MAPVDATLADEWRQLVAASARPCPLLGPDHAVAWWRAHGAGKPFIVQVRRSGRLVAVLPLRLMCHHYYGRDRMVLAGWGDENTDRSGPVVHAEHLDAVEDLADAIQQIPGWDLLELPQVLTDDPVTTALIREFERAGLRHGALRTLDSPVVSLADSFDRQIDGMAATHQRRLRRLLRSPLARQATVQRLVGVGALEVIEPVVEASWQHRAGTSVLSTHQDRMYHSAVLDGVPGARIETLIDADGSIVAFEMLIVSGGVAWSLKLGYAEERRSQSPGAVLRARLVSQLINEGVRRFEMLGDDEPYKRIWGGGTRPHVRLHVFRDTVPLRVVHAAWYRAAPAVRILTGRGTRKEMLG